MDTRVGERDGLRFVSCDEPMTNIDDALGLVSECAGHGANLLLLADGSLPPDFFDLSSRFAGEFVQKMQNYRITVAAVIPTDEAHTERFKEFLVEARLGRQFRAFEDRDAAERWLCST
jgi:hypothetical protein